MAIVNSMENGYFVLDTPDVRWPVADGGRVVRVSITPLNGAEASFSENYTPDADGSIVLRGMAGLLQPYTAPCPTPLRRELFTGSGVWLATLSRAQWTATLYKADGTTTVSPVHSSYAYYASQRTNTRPGATAIWLSRYTARDIVPQQPLIACCMLTPDVEARIRVYWRDDEGLVHESMATPSLEGVPEETPSQAAVLHYRLEALAELVDVDAGSIEQVDFQLINAGEVADTLRYRIDRSHKRMLRVLAFTNCFGMIETEAMTGSEDSNTELEGDFSYMDDQYEKVAQQLVTTSRICAGNVTDERRDSIRDSTTSPEVFIAYGREGCCWQQVTITDLELRDNRPHDTFQTAFLTLRPSHRHQEIVSRGPGVDKEIIDGIFDYTFDDSFN